MLEMFVAALMSAADTTVVAQSPTAPAAAVSATQSSAADQSQGYEQVTAICQDVDGQIAVPTLGGGVIKGGSTYQYDSGPYASRSFTPISGISIPQDISVKDWAAKVNLKVTELDAPKHGKVIVEDSAWYSYSYIPDKDYLGKDRGSGAEAGQALQVNDRFWIVPVVAPQREKMFNHSA